MFGPRDNARQRSPTWDLRRGDGNTDHHDAVWGERRTKNLQYTNTSTAACSADFTTSSNFRSFDGGSSRLERIGRQRSPAKPTL
jgi:hypothetical protein